SSCSARASRRPCCRAPCRNSSKPSESDREPKTGGRSRLGADAADGGPVPRPPPCPSHATAASRPARLNRTDQASEPLLRPHPRGVELAIPVLQDFFKRAGEIRRGRERRHPLAYADETVPVAQRRPRGRALRVRAGRWGRRKAPAA